jgi:2-polyprenyl-3-methyl-5-hydroxy-6-metoxy-1,4-benzoquinol methylase
MEEFKKEIYNLWGKHNPITFPVPTKQTIEQQTIVYDYYIKKFFSQNKESAILDIGCGYGVFLQACKQAGYKNIQGVEAILECINFAATQFGINSIKQDDILTYLGGVPEKSLDIITAWDVMEHFKKSELITLFTLIRQKLKPGGKFIMHVPNAASSEGLYIFFSDLTHEWAFTDFLIQEIFSLVGFNSTVVESEYRPDASMSYKLRSWLYRILIPSGHKEFNLSANLLAVGTVE